MGRAPFRGNFVLAVIAGLAAAAVGSIIWMGVALGTGWQVDFLALVVAVLVGSAIRSSGRGSHVIFGALGVFYTLLGCLVGRIGVTMFQATADLGWDYYAAFKHIHLGALILALINQTTWTMAAIYAVAAFVAYKLSFRK